LREALEGQNIKGIANIRFENIEEEEILTLSDDQKLTLS
jgi:hypothetical protein